MDGGLIWEKANLWCFNEKNNSFEKFQSNLIIYIGDAFSTNFAKKLAPIGDKSSLKSNFVL